ncbi:MAG TPA: hypothetical protein VMN57_07115 [Anaerolineales bacterium]|nr:hypothetical protein [Anaerolineales bacterium]
MNDGKLRLALISFATASALLLGGCMGENEQRIQGTWEYFDEHLAEIAGESQLTVVWHFSAGTFIYQACCFNVDIEFGGGYRIIDSSADQLTLELYNTYGTGARMDGEIGIVINRETGTLNIQGAEPFRKVGP